ncbi:hypothetical protein SHY80_10890, partial [Streptococcus suis]|uniref:hypothetical protein n=1 Tax=Streptococcus suis TaxID=1307 RepID=UPI0029C35943
AAEDAAESLGEVEDTPSVPPASVKSESENLVEQSAKRGAVGVIKSRLTGPWMINDLDRNVLSRAVDAIEKEVAGVVEDLTEQVEKVRHPEA